MTQEYRNKYDWMVAFGNSIRDTLTYQFLSHKDGKTWEQFVEGWLTAYLKKVAPPVHHGKRIKEWAFDGDNCIRFNFEE